MTSAGAACDSASSGRMSRSGASPATASASERDARHELDDRRELRPERDQLAATAQCEHLVDGRAARKARGDDRERQNELDRAPAYCSAPNTFLMMLAPAATGSLRIFCS